LLLKDLRRLAASLAAKIARWFESRSGARVGRTSNFGALKVVNPFVEEFVDKNWPRSSYQARDTLALIEDGLPATNWG
jgi:hypothetical protein